MLFLSSRICLFSRLVNSSFKRTYKQISWTDLMATSSSQGLKQQIFDYFLVLDFEATCEKSGRINPQEIIEFPVLKINAKSLQTESMFHQYVQPFAHPQLSPFCIELTGIVQEMVDGQPYFDQVLKEFNKWMLDNDLLNPNVKSVFVTCGDWDLNIMLPEQCSYMNINIPHYFKEWINIKKAYPQVMNHYCKGMMDMLTGLDLQHHGRHHSGKDDCTNIGNILCELLKRGYEAKVTKRRPN